MNLRGAVLLTAVALVLSGATAGCGSGNKSSRSSVATTTTTPPTTSTPATRRHKPARHKPAPAHGGTVSSGGSAYPASGGAAVSGSTSTVKGQLRSKLGPKK